MTTMRVVLGPRDSHPPVLHRRTSEFFLVLSGSMDAMVAGRSRRFRAGDYAHLPPGTAHAFRAGPKGVEVLAVFSPPLSPARPDIVPAGNG